MPAPRIGGIASTRLLLQLGRRLARIAPQFGRHEGAALVRFDERVGGGGLLSENRLGPALAIVLGLVAETKGIRVVVPRVLVSRDFLDDLETVLRMVNADRHELREVARRNPDRKPALVHRIGIDIADPHAETLHPVLVRVEAADRFAEDLRHPIAAVGLRIHPVIDDLVAAVETRGMVARREEDPFRAVSARGLEDVVEAHDVGLENGFPRALQREAREGDDRLHPLGDGERVVHAGDVGLDELLAVGQSRDRLDVGKLERITPGELAAQVPAHVAGRTGDEDFFQCALPLRMDEFTELDIIRGPESRQDRPMRKIVAMALSLMFSTLAGAGDLDKLRVGDTAQGFRATTIYLDEADRALGARFVHLKTRHTLDLLQIESVPQAYTWINTIPVSDQGESHTQEHLLLLKGTRGRTLSTRQTMSLSGSSAFTQQWRTSYFFNTAAGEDVFFDLYAEQIRAMLLPNYDDEEIRREVRFFGVTQNADGTLRLEEQGTVYAEMVSSTANPFSRLYRAAEQLVYGRSHPLSYNAGGEPSGIRTMKPEDIRAFQKSTHHLANMGTIAAFSAATPVESVLARFDRVLSRADPQAQPRRPESLDDLPKPDAAPVGSPLVSDYPQRNEQQPSPMAIVWPAARTLDTNEEFLADLFVANLAGDPTTNLYKIFIDGKTRKIDLGARSVSGFVQAYGGYPIFLLLRDVTPSNFNEAKLASVRTLVTEELRRIAALPDESPELREFNERIANRIIERRRDLVKFTSTPPGFGFRRGNCRWMDHLR